MKKTKALAPTGWPSKLVSAVKQTGSETNATWGGSLPRAYSLGALLARALPPKTPLIHPWLSAGESCLLWGSTGAGKSMLAMTLALGAAGGGAVIGWTFPTPVKVLWVDGEQSERDIKLRFQTLESALTGFSPARAHSNITIMARTANPGGTFLDIGNAHQAGDIVAMIEEGGFGLVVFDNLSTLSDSIDEENAAAAFKPMQALLARLKGSNVAAIVVHHAGKNNNSYRGSSNIATTFERIIGLTRPKEITSNAGKISVLVEIEKYRDKPPEGFKFSFNLELESGPGSSCTWVVGGASEAWDSWEAFKARGALTKSEFVKARNSRTGQTKNPAHFRRDFVQAWLKAGVSPCEIKAAGG